MRTKGSSEGMLRRNVQGRKERLWNGDEMEAQLGGHKLESRREELKMGRLEGWRGGGEVEGRG